MSKTESANADCPRRVVRCKLTLCEANHLLSLMADNERNGEYYGPREQYWRRSERIKKKFIAPNAEIRHDADNAVPQLKGQANE